MQQQQQERCKVTAGVMPALGRLTSVSMVGESSLDIVCEVSEDVYEFLTDR